MTFLPDHALSSLASVRVAAYRQSMGFASRDENTAAVVAKAAASAVAAATATIGGSLDILT